FSPTRALGIVSLFLWACPVLKWVGLGALAPSADPALDGKLNLAASAWFTILASSLSWIMPGVNAVLARRTRPDLVKDAPYIRWLPYLGAIWLIFTILLYWFAGIAPIYNAISGGQEALAYLNASGVTFVIIMFVVGFAWYFVQSARNRRAGVETELMYQMLPPD